MTHQFDSTISICMNRLYKKTISVIQGKGERGGGEREREIIKILNICLTVKMLHNFHSASLPQLRRDQSFIAINIFKYFYILLGLIVKSKMAELTANGGSGGLGLDWTRSTGCKVCCVCGGLPLLRRLRFSGAGVSSLCGVKAGVSGGVCVGLCEPGSGLPSSESFRLLVCFLAVVSDSGIPDDVDTTVTFAISSGELYMKNSTARFDKQSEYSS